MPVFRVWGCLEGLRASWEVFERSWGGALDVFCWCSGVSRIVFGASLGRHRDVTVYKVFGGLLLQPCVDTATMPPTKMARIEVLASAIGDLMPR